MQLRFHLAGINNQNFLMRDEQTGTFWQQINGLAVSGPLAGKRLPLVFADELTFALWKTEQPGGSVLDDVPRFSREYAPVNWDVRMAKVPTVISYAQAGLKPRDLMIGVRAFGASRAFPYQAILKEKLIQDHVGSEPIFLIVGPDDRSVRAFRQRIPGGTSVSQFYRISEKPTDKLFMDANGSEWNFRGCSVNGPLESVCLEPVEIIKDYWFDWRNYNPETTVYGIKQKIR
jgi:Protein of unknown function (DUF3179)